MAKTRTKPPGTGPWWLDDVSETCPGCIQAYAYHTEVRCVACDGPLCPFCVQITTTMEVFCSSCVDVDEGNRGATAP